MALSVVAITALSAFSDQLDALDDAGLAVAAGVTEAEAAEFRATGGKPAEPEPVVEKPKKGPKAKPEKAAEPEPVVEDTAEPARGIVAVVNRRFIGATQIRRGDFYDGQRAVELYAAAPAFFALKPPKA